MEGYLKITPKVRSLAVAYTTKHKMKYSVWFWNRIHNFTIFHSHIWASSMHGKIFQSWHLRDTCCLVFHWCDKISWIWLEVFVKCSPFWGHLISLSIEWGACASSSVSCSVVCIGMLIVFFFFFVLYKTILAPIILQVNVCGVRLKRPAQPSILFSTIVTWN